MLVLFVEPEGHEALDREYRHRDLRDLAEGPGLLDRLEPGSRRRSRPHHPCGSRSLKSLYTSTSALTTVVFLQIAHYPTLRSIPSDLAPPVLEEVALYKEALRKCYKSFGAEMVAFEVARSTGKGGHAHVQVSLVAILCIVVFPDAAGLLACSHLRRLTSDPCRSARSRRRSRPKPSRLSSRKGPSSTTTLRRCPTRRASTHAARARATKARSGQSTSRSTCPAARASCIGSSRARRSRCSLAGEFAETLLSGLDGADRLDHHSETLAVLLHAPDRADWKRCAKPDAEEKKDAQRFKQVFKSFDPST